MQLPKIAALALIALVASAIFLFGCGGTQSDFFPTFISGSVTEAERNAAFDEVSTFYDTIKAEPDRAQEVLGKITSMPIFVYTEITKSRDVVGWFKDGRRLMIATSLDRDFVATTTTPPSKHSTRQLTSGRKAMFINAMEPARLDPYSEVAPLLAKKGYEVSQSEGAIEDFNNIKDVSLLYVHAHGSRGRDKNRVERFWYTTSTPFSKQNDQTYKQFLDNGTVDYHMVEVFSSDGKSAIQKKYGLSHAYLKNADISFSENASWFSQSCSSYNDEIVNFAIGDRKVAIYMGWTEPQTTGDSTESYLALFGLLLGEETIVQFPKIPPPFSISEANNVLRSTSRAGSSKLLNESGWQGVESYLDYKVGNSEITTIVPSVSATLVDFAKNTLTIVGYFSSQSSPGRVTLDNVPLTIKTWADGEIEVDLPAAQSGTLVVNAIGDPASTSYLSSNEFKYQALSVNINPVSTKLGYSATKIFAVEVVSGSIPANATYNWEVLGDGTVNGQDNVTTTESTVTYKSGTVDGNDQLSLKVLNADKAVLAIAKASIEIGNIDYINFTIAGTWDPQKTPANGSYLYTDSQGSRYSPESGIEAVSFSSNIGKTDETIGALITFRVNPGQPLSAPTSWPMAVTGQAFGIGQFVFTLSTNQTDPDDPDSMQFKVGTSGTLVINSVTALANNQKRVNFSFDINSDTGGTIKGTGSCTYTGT